MAICVDSGFHYWYMDRGYYCAFIVPDELNAHQRERQEIASLFFML